MRRCVSVVLGVALFCCGCHLFEQYGPIDASADGAVDTNARLDATHGDVRTDGDRCRRDAAIDGSEHVYARRADSAEVAVDGRLDEYGPLRSEYRPDSDQRTDNQMSVRARWTRQHLYLGIRVRDTSIETPDSEKYWNRDSVEVAWEPDLATPESRSDRVWKWGVTADGALNAARVRDGVWNEVEVPAGTDFAFASTLEDGYRLELALPWDISNISPDQRDTVLICIRNNDRDDGTTERLGCSTTEPFQNPETWNALYLLDSRRSCRDR